MYRYGDLLRISLASAGNDHRLGANEAPPAIISVFLGEQLSRILEEIKEGGNISSTDDYIIDLGISKLPSIFRDHTDRNRTSPFAFTGQKFEFRAVGSSASVSLPNTILSAAVADSINVLANEIERAAKGGKELKDAVLQVLQKHIIETEPVRFEGNNYSQDWEKEAAKRGLPKIKRTAYALDAIVDPKNAKMLMDLGVLSEREIQSRYNTKLEQYITSLEIEAGSFCDIVETRVLPAAISYQQQLLSVVKDLKALKGTISDGALDYEVSILEQVSTRISALHTGCQSIKNAVEKAEEIDDLPKKAKYFADEIVDLLADVRQPADELEGLIPDDLWPLPKYSEMLFIM